MKGDKVDARILAHLLRSSLVAESYVPPKELRDVRALVRHRASIVKMRTMVKNQVHALIDRYGFRCECSDLFGREGMKWLKPLELKPLDRLMLDNHLQDVECLNGQVVRVDEEIRSRASEDEDVRLLLSMTGVDVYMALLIRSEVGRINSFLDYKEARILDGVSALAAPVGKRGAPRRHNEAGLKDAQVGYGGGC